MCNYNFCLVAWKIIQKKQLLNYCTNWLSSVLWMPIRSLWCLKIVCLLYFWLKVNNVQLSFLYNYFHSKWTDNCFPLFFWIVLYYIFSHLKEREDSLYYDRKNRFAGSPQINKELMDEVSINYLVCLEWNIDILIYTTFFNVETINVLYSCSQSKNLLNSGWPSLA